MACAVLVMTLVAVISGLLETLVPLHMGADGYSALAISMVLGAAGVASAATQFTVGQAFDRTGGVRIATVAIAAMAALMLLLAVPDSAGAIALIYVVGTPAISAQYAVSFPLAAAGADEVGLPHGIVLGAMNVCLGLRILRRPGRGSGDRRGQIRPASPTCWRRLCRWRRCPCCARWHSHPASARNRLDGPSGAAMIVLGTPLVRVPTTESMEVAWI